MKESYIYKPVQYFLTVNLITWTAFSIAAYFSYQPKSWQNEWNNSIFEIIGILAPFGTALWMILSSGNQELKKNFFNKLFDLKLIKLSSVPVILFFGPASAAISILLSSLFGESLDQFLLVKEAVYSTGMVPTPLILFGAAFFEELGWKGYGMDSLRSKTNFFTASLIYALLWAFWHIPLFFVNDFYQNILLKTNPWFALNFILSIFPGAFIINWLWHRNNGSILTAVLVHTSINFQAIFHMGQIAKCIETVIWSVLAVVIVYTNKKMFWGNPPEKIGSFN